MIELPPDEVGSPPQSARTARRVLDILELLAEKPRGLTLSEVATQLAIPVSSVHSVMRVLLTRGYVDRGNDGRRYRLGSRLPEVSRKHLNAQDPYAVARQAMYDLAQRSGETVHVAVLSGQDIIYVAGTPSRHTLSVTTRVDARLPAHATAAGKALLATLSDDQIMEQYHQADWPRSIASAPVSLDALLHELSEVRWTGYAHDLEGIDTGLHCVAAVLPRDDDRPPIAVTLSMPTPRVQGDLLWTLINALRDVTTGAGNKQSHCASRRPLIGWSLAQTHNSVYAEMRRAATVAMESIGGDILWTDAHDDEQKQTADVSRLLEEPLDALLILPVNAVSSASLFSLARRREIPTVCFQRPARSREFAFFAGGNTYRQGCLQAEAIASALNGRGGNYIVEGDPYTDNARNIAQGNRDTLARYPGLTLLGSQPSGLWSAATAGVIAAEALDAFGSDRLHGIIAANDDMALAIAEVLAARGLARQIALVGGDGDQQTIGLIRSGLLQGTAFQNSTDLAITTLTYVVGVLRGSNNVSDLPRYDIFHAPAGPPVSGLDVPYTWIDASNVDILEQYWATRTPATYALKSADTRGARMVW